MPDCVFCKIVRNELPSVRVYEDDETLAILTIEPVATGHTLVIPKAHIKTVFDASAEAWARVQETVRAVAAGVERALHTDGLNINMNNREDAGQLVDHLHIHIIPRFKNDGLVLWPHHARREEEGEPIAERIRRAFA